MPTLSPDGLQCLDPSECYRLLRDTYVGRLGYICEDRPVIVPVNYRVDDDGAILTLTAPGAKLEAARSGAIMSLQAGADDELYQEGWSVLISGTVEVFDDPGAIDRAIALTLRPWARQVPRTHLLRISPDRIEGRRLI